jgi:hypothetical protein
LLEREQSSDVAVVGADFVGERLVAPGEVLGCGEEAPTRGAVQGDDGEDHRADQLVAELGRLGVLG